MKFVTRVVLQNTIAAQEGAMAPGSIRGGSGGLSYRTCGSESQKRDRGQSKREGQKEKDCREGEEEENVGVLLTVLGQSASRRC